MNEEDRTRLEEFRQFRKEVRGSSEYLLVGIDVPVPSNGHLSTPVSICEPYLQFEELSRGRKSAHGCSGGKRFLPFWISFKKKERLPGAHSLG